MIKQSEGYLSREVRIELINGGIELYQLHIVKPVNPVSENPQSGKKSRLRIFMSGFEIIPFSEEIPFIIYIDRDIIIKEIAKGEFVMLI